MRFWRNGSLIGPIIRITFKAEVDGRGGSVRAVRKNLRSHLNGCGRSLTLPEKIGCGRSLTLPEKLGADGALPSLKNWVRTEPYPP